jgi:hypothetical protein
MTSPPKEQGLSLADIADIGEDVEVGDGKKLKVKGISAKGCLILIVRFPDMQRWLSGDIISINDVVLQAPEAVGAIIAAGTGNPGDPDSEEIASGLPIETQINIVEAVFRQTFRSGFGPFVSRVLRMHEAAVAVKSGSDGKGPDMKSLPESKPSLPMDTPQASSGTTPLAK